MPQQILNTNFYNRFYADYLSGKETVHQFLIHPDKVDWQHQCQQIEPDSKIHCQLKNILIDQNADLKSETAQRYISHLDKKKSVIVITGQQLGLLASPMYTIYKAISTIKLAEHLNKKQLGYMFVPVFWLESEDHDFEEVNHFGIWRRQFEPQVLRYEGLNREKVSLRHYIIEPSIQSLFEQFKTSIHETEFTSEILFHLQDMFKPGVSWQDAICNLLKYCLADHGLLFFKPGANKVKELAVDFYSEFLERSAEVRGEFSNRSVLVQKAGYKNQVTDIPGKTYVHLEDDQLQRNHLYVQDETFVIQETARTFTRSEMQKLLKNNPHKFSTAVVSRPVLQSWLFPTAAYIAGPAEIAYWAQLGGIFDSLDIQMPVLYPRISATLVEPKISRYIDKHQVDIDSIGIKKEQFIDAYFKQKVVESRNNPFNDSRFKMKELRVAIQTYLKELDPTLVNVAEKTFDRIQRQLDQLENRSFKTQENKSQILVSHLEQIHASFFPQNHPQERFASVVYFFNKFGKQIIGQLFEQLNLTEWRHQVVDLTVD
jgi:bacillithiol biosynthesis cysteine-adding enzyme BshC